MVFDHKNDVPFHHREVHIAVALIAIAAATVVGSVPVMMFAQETTPPPTQEQMMPPPPQQPAFDPSQCFAKCGTMKQECTANVKPDDQVGLTNCSNAVNECFKGCGQQGAPGTTGNFQPPQGGQFGQQGPGGGTGSVQNENPCEPKGTVASFVCARNGRNAKAGVDVTYFNSCDAKNDGAEILHDGVCEGHKPCGNVADPVCGNDGKTWVSSCYAIESGGGVKYAGPCQNVSGGFNGSGGQQQGGQFGPQGGQFGPQGDRMGGPNQGGEMDAKQKEALMKKVKKQMIGFSQKLVSVKARIAKVEKKGIKAPSELVDAVAKAEDTIKKIQAAETPEELADVTEGLQDVVQIIQEQMPNLERLNNLPTIYKRVSQQLSKFDRLLAADKKAALKSKIDLTKEIADYEASLNEVKAAYADAKAKIDAGDIEEGFQMFEDSVFGAMDAVGEHHDNITQIRQLTTTMRAVDREIKANQTRLNQLKKKNDVSSAQAVLDEGKAKLAELKAAAAVTPVDTDAVFDLLQELADIRDRFTEELNNILGVETKSDLDTGLRPLDINQPDLQGFGGGPGPKPDMGPLF
ncbi:MAG: hypothetical protein AAB692_01890 [Patescibacteria group bacterium]